MPGFDHFDFLAPFYDRVIKMGDKERLIELLDLPAKGPLLDAGGGTGRVTQAFDGLADPLVITDLSMEMLRQAKTKNGFQLTCSHTEYLPFPSGYFDRIVMVDALHHVCDHVETANELWRVLKPGGRLLIEEPDVRQMSVKLIALAEKIALMRSHFISPPKIQSLFAYTNAEVSVDVDGYNARILVIKH